MPLVEKGLRRAAVKVTPLPDWLIGAGSAAPRTVATDACSNKKIATKGHSKPTAPLLENGFFQTRPLFFFFLLKPAKPPSHIFFLLTCLSRHRLTRRRGSAQSSDPSPMATSFIHPTGGGLRLNPTSTPLPLPPSVGRTAFHKPSTTYPTSSECATTRPRPLPPSPDFDRVCDPHPLTHPTSLTPLAGRSNFKTVPPYPTIPRECATTHPSTIGRPSVHRVGRRLPTLGSILESVSWRTRTPSTTPKSSDAKEQPSILPVLTTPTRHPDVTSLDRHLTPTLCSLDRAPRPPPATNGRSQQTDAHKHSRNNIFLLNGR
jgi:hypothetical protein